MVIETERLRLLCLSPRQLRLWCEDVAGLERELACTYRAEPMEGMFRDIVLGQADAAERDAESYVWHSFFLLLRRTDSVVVGAADFKDLPDATGEVEIGYGLGADFTGCGYMSETVRAMCAWALAQPGVSRVVAETDLDGFASQRVLRRCGFLPLERAGVWWVLEKTPGTERAE